jgi:hypothetical protein
LVLKHRNWGSDQRPLIRIRKFHAERDDTTRLDWRNRVNKVVLEGLGIHIPARGRVKLKTQRAGASH